MFVERYGLGRFQPGHEAQTRIPAYAEYPAIYNSTIVQQARLGLEAEVSGIIRIDPCVVLAHGSAAARDRKGPWVTFELRLSGAGRTRFTIGRPRA